MAGEGFGITKTGEVAEGEEFDFDGWLAKAGRPDRKVTVYAAWSDETVAKIQDIFKQVNALDYDAAKSAREGGKASGDSLGSSPKRKIDKLLAEAETLEASMLPRRFVVQGLTYDEKEEARKRASADHPDLVDAAEAGRASKLAEIQGVYVAAAGLVSPVVPAKKMVELYQTIGQRQFSPLVDAVIDLTEGGVVVPKAPSLRSRSTPTQKL